MMAKTFSDEELKDIYVFALDLGRRAGKILIDGVEKRTGAAGARDMGKQEEKMNAVDIVTQTDLGASLDPGKEGGANHVKQTLKRL
jgi:myo-inositol-1(or 4)-monophosphatase